MNYTNFTRFAQLPKCSDQQINFKNEYFMEILFQIVPYFCMHMYISSKITHAKYAVAETRISGVKRITVIHVLRKYLRPLLTMYFCIEFQDFKLMLNHV